MKCLSTSRNNWSSDRPMLTLVFNTLSSLASLYSSPNTLTPTHSFYARKLPYLSINGFDFASSIFSHNLDFASVIQIRFRIVWLPFPSPPRNLVHSWWVFLSSYSNLTLLNMLYSLLCYFFSLPSSLVAFPVMVPEHLRFDSSVDVTHV